MTVDVAVVGSPFFDLTFEGLDRVPSVGEEVTGRALHVAPGGTGMQAIGLARLGLSVALIGPLGDDVGGRVVREALEHEGVRVLPERRTGATPTTALLSTDEGVAMATVLGGDEPSAADVQAAGGRAYVASVDRLHLIPPGVSVYAVTGGLEIAGLDEPRTGRLASARAFVCNAAEARALTAEEDPERAAAVLGRQGATAVVTIGPDGAVAVEDGRAVRATAPQVDVVDATGAGDLFVSAFVWADLRGTPLEARLAWATLYATLSTTAPTALAGAVDVKRLLDEGARLGLSPP